MPRAPEYDVITNLDSQTAATSLPGLVLRWLVRLLLSWEVFVVASATCASGVILSDDFAKSRPRYLQSTASATPRRYFASTSAYFSSYCPDLQPIELFWAAGKNWARENNTDHSRTLEKTVAHLRAGWHTRNGKGAKCDRLVAKSIEKANERVAYGEFLSGAVEGGLVVSGEVDLEVGVDLIGRATRALCKRALERGALDEDEDDSALHGDDGASDDDDDDDDDGEF